MATVKTVQGKIGSFDNINYTPGGGKVSRCFANKLLCLRCF